ncbi:MAG: hypothetical protein ACTSR8_02385 [Promethearchaeota archaeon]
MYESQNDYDVTLNSLNSVKFNFEKLKNSIPNKSIFLGFDGYIDSLYTLVRSRENLSEWKRIETMSFFGQRILEVAGSSANVERVLKRRISGGFAPNTCKAVNGLGVNTFLVAAIGYPKIDEMFDHIAKRETVDAIPIGNPGETIGLEFDDGKIMLTDFENIFKITWDSIIERLGFERLMSLLQKTNTWGFGHWSLLLDFDNIWKHLLNDVFPNLRNLKNKLFFVDLADLKKRNKSDILEMLKLLRKIDEEVPVMLSLNDQEAIDISKAIDEIRSIDPKKKKYADYIEGGKIMNDVLNLSYLVIHSPHFATISTRDSHYWVTEGFTSKPKFTTGAGDHFHSGTAIGLTCNLSAPEALIIGNALTAIFVRTGNSPTLQELSQFIDYYIEYVENDYPNFPKKRKLI